jgi:hypothetical protein
MPAMSANDQDLFGTPTIGKRNFHAGSRGKSRRNTRYNLDLHTCLFQNLQFFSPARPKTRGSPLLRRTTISPPVAYRISSSLISSCVMLFCPHLFPIFTTLVCAEISAKTSADTGHHAARRWQGSACAPPGRLADPDCPDPRRQDTPFLSLVRMDGSANTFLNGVAKGRRSSPAGGMYRRGA